MEFFLGLLTAVVFFLCLATAFYIGQRSAKKTPAPKPIDEKERLKIEQYNKHFRELMSYSVEKAYGKKVE